MNTSTVQSILAEASHGPIGTTHRRLRPAASEFSFEEGTSANNGGGSAIQFAESAGSSSVDEGGGRVGGTMKRVGARINPTDLSNGEEPATRVKSRRRYFYLVKPYYPNPRINYLERSLESSLLGFRDPAVAMEFRRFMMRDVTILMLGVTISMGGIIYPAFLIDLKQWTVWNLLGAAVCAIIICADVYNHFFRANTYRIATIRQISQFIMSLPTAMVLCFIPFYSYNACGIAVDYTRELGLARPHPVVTEEWMEWSCRNVHNPFAAAMVTMAVYNFPLHPFLTASIFVMTFILFVLARFAIDHEAETATEFGVKAWFFLAQSCITFVIIVARYRLSMASFRATIDVERSVQGIERLMEEVDLLLCAMVPSSALVRMMSYETVADYAPEATVIFADMVQFTQWSSDRTPIEIVAMLNAVCFALDRLAEMQRVEKIKTVGDAYWAVCNIPTPQEDHAERMTEFGRKLLHTLDTLNINNPAWDVIEMRVGIETGPLYGGVLGTKQLSYEVYGETSRMAMWIQDFGLPGRVTVSQKVLQVLSLSKDIDGVEEIVFTHPEKSDVNVTVYCLLRESLAYHRELAPQQASSQSMVHSTEHRLEAAAEQRSRSITPPLGETGEVMYSKEEAKKRRQIFVEQRAAATLEKMTRASGRARLTLENLAQQESTLETNEGFKEATLENLELIFSGRRYKYFFYDLGVSTVEEKYKEWVEAKTRSLRMLCRVAVLLTVVVLLVSLAMEGATLPVLNWVFLVLCVALTGIDLGLAAKQKYILAQVVLNHVALVLLIISAGVGVPTHTSIATNDVTYMHALVVTFAGIGNVGPVAAGTVFIANLLTFCPLVLVLSIDQVMSSAVIMMLSQSTLLMQFLFIVMEKQYRRQFADMKIASFLVWENEKRKLEQEVLLDAMVPMHVVPDLMRWIHTDMHASDAPSKRFPKMCVAFIQLLAPKSLGGATNIAMKELGAARRRQMRVLEEGAESEVAESDEVSSAVPTMDQSEFRSDDGAAGSDGRGSQGSLGDEEDEGLADHNFKWLAPAHSRVDTILSKFDSIDKVKTIGETVMVAGPFQEKHNYRDSADQLMAAMAMIQSETPISVGLHVGEIIGSIVGSNRLCFDIFGDAVNVASRAMTGGQIGKIRVTEEFYQDYTSGEWSHKYSDGTLFSDPVKQAAKGKGLITVRQVINTGFHTVVTQPLLPNHDTAAAAAIGRGTRSHSNNSSAVENSVMHTVSVQSQGVAPQVEEM